MLALPGRGVLNGTWLAAAQAGPGGRTGPPSGSVGCHPLLAAAAVQPPPGPEPARVVPEREVGVEHDPVHAVIAAGQQISVPLGEVIGHLRACGILGAACARVN